VWDVTTGKRRYPPLKHGGRVHDAAFSPNGRRVIAASADKTARVWDAETGQPVSPPLKHRDTVYRATFDPSSRTVITASFDGTARAWDAETGQPVSPPLKQPGVIHAQFSPDGRRIITFGDGSREVRVWEVPPDDRPARDWVLLSQFLTGHRLDRHGAPGPLSLEKRQRLWQQLRTKFPQEFRAAPA
jgi:WD40 repeat protein